MPTKKTVEATEYSTESKAPAKAKGTLSVPGAGLGRRKEAIARVRIKPGSGVIKVNGRELAEYFPNKLHQQLITDPFKVLGLQDSYDVVARIQGGVLLVKLEHFVLVSPVR